jgi:sRNA-binding protein
VEEVADLPAASIAGVSATSDLGKRLTGMTIGDVGAMTRDEFVEHATLEVSTRRRKQAAQQAEEVWRRAREAGSAYEAEPEDDVDDIPEPDQ